VITNQVFEHVFNPDKFLSEINRVTKRNGVLLLSVPFVWDEHEQPFDFARYTSFGLTHLLNTHGFEVLDLKKVQADFSLIFQLINIYLYKVTKNRNPYVNLITTVILMSSFNILGVLISKLLPANSDLYLNNIVLAVKKNSKR